MAAGGFKEFVAGEILDQDDINDYLMQGVLVFAGTAARGSAITSPVEGQFAFLKDSDQLTYYSGTAWEELAVAVTARVDYVAVAGGGGAGFSQGGYGGAGGGGGGGYLDGFIIGTGTYKVKVGAGGAGATGTGTQPGLGTSSEFSTFVCVGGGSGGNIGASGNLDPRVGGSGGGKSASGAGALGTFNYPETRQGNAGGNGESGNWSGGGGGGAGGPGGNAWSTTPTTGASNGGFGRKSSITGTSVGYGGGGGGGQTNGTTYGLVYDGGGVGGNPPANGTANTGGGGGGSTSGNGGTGGSGVVILRLPNSLTVTKGASHTMTQAAVEEDIVYTFTAGDDNITIA